jgi:hypothetical protein
MSTPSPTYLATNPEWSKNKNGTGSRLDADHSKKGSFLHADSQPALVSRRSVTVSHTTVLSLLGHEGSGSGRRCGAIPGKRLFLLRYRHRRVPLQRPEGRVKTRSPPVVPNSGNQVVLNPGNRGGPNS